MTAHPKRTADDWLEAAYTRFVTDGPPGIRVEVIARDLGATKGSFYWHYADRSALVEAVMKRWEHNETDILIDMANAGGTPCEKLTLLYQEVGKTISRRRGETRLYVEAATDGIGDFVRRVSQRRIDYVSSVLESAGVPAAEARRRGTISLATAVGLEQLRSATAFSTADSEELTKSAIRMAFSEYATG